jgi:RNA polymerase sigma-70 factor (ECF subfamily)
VTQDPTEFDYALALAGCARGQGADLQRLYEQESPRLLGVVQRMVRNLPLAEDIVHDAFINIWKRAASFDASRGEARGWIYAITRNLALNHLRDNQRELAADDDMMDALDATQSMAAWRDTEDVFAWLGSAERMQPCLEQLEPVRRNCVLHAYVEGLSHSEIAARVGAPLGTVKAWIKRSLLNLRECLQ